MKPPEEGGDGPTIRDRKESGSDIAAPDTVREPGLGLPALGELVSDRYRIERVIGSGGMAHVLAVRQVKLDQLFAMKILDPALAEDSDARERFAREAKAMAALTSAHTVRVHDVAELENGLPYLVMDYLDGEDLGRVLRRRGALPIEEAVDLIDQACIALEEAHAAGLVHRDLKPENLFVAKDANGFETLRVLDFGIARGIGGKVGKLETLTRHGDVIGTLAFMAPEQIRNAKGVDARTDVWGIGACLYRILTNARPFAGGSEGSLIAAILAQEPVPIRQVRPEVPPALEQVVVRCMKKSPADRFATVKELREMLKLALAAGELVGDDDGTLQMSGAPVRPPKKPGTVKIAASNPPPSGTGPQPAMRPVPTPPPISTPGLAGNIPPSAPQLPMPPAKSSVPFVVILLVVAVIVFAGGLFLARLLTGHS